MSRSVHVASRRLARRKSGTAARPPPRASGDVVVPQPAPATTHKRTTAPIDVRMIIGDYVRGPDESRSATADGLKCAMILSEQQFALE
jgi:hypothetical protein